jgi:hypothetical protein
MKFLLMENKLNERRLKQLITKFSQFSTFSSPIIQSNDRFSGLSSVEKLNNNAANSSCTNDRNNFKKSSSLELILSPIIQSRR